MATYSLNGLSSNQSIMLGSSYTLTGTVSAGSGDRLTKVTAAVTGPGISGSNTTAMTSGTISSTSYGLNNFRFRTSTFSQSGTYTIGIWANTEQSPSPSAAIGSFQITVTQPASEPNVSGLSSNQSIMLGSSYTLTGTVSAGSGDRLTKVMAAVTGPGISGSNTTAMTSGTISSISYGLNNFTFRTSTFSQSGTYTIGIWANTEQYPSPSAAIGSFQITVSEPIPPFRMRIRGQPLFKNYSIDTKNQLIYQKILIPKQEVLCQEPDE